MKQIVKEWTRSQSSQASSNEIVPDSDWYSLWVKQVTKVHAIKEWNR